MRKQRKTEKTEIKNYYGTRKDTVTKTEFQAGPGKPSAPTGNIVAKPRKSKFYTSF